MMRSDKADAPRHPLNAADDILRKIDAAISTSRTAQAVERTLQSAAPGINFSLGASDVAQQINNDLNPLNPPLQNQWCHNSCECTPGMHDDPSEFYDERDSLGGTLVAFINDIEPTPNNQEALMDMLNQGIHIPESIRWRIA